MPKHSFILNGKLVSVDCEDDVRTLWVIRDLLGVVGPKYGCGINVCKACTCHINGKAFNPCSVPIRKIRSTDEITTIEGLPATVKKKLHPMQRAWLNMDVPQCGYCQPGQIMSAVSMVNEVRRKEGRRTITDKDIEQIRNVCRCGTYPRIREAIREGAKGMPNPKKRRKKHKQHHKPKHQAKGNKSAVEPQAATGSAQAAPQAPVLPEVVQVPAAPPAPTVPDVGSLVK